MKWAIRGMWVVGVAYGWSPVWIEGSMDWWLIKGMFETFTIYAPIFMSFIAAMAVAGLVGIMSMFGYSGWKNHKVIIILGALALAAFGWMAKDSFNSDEV